jgi:hypothetical protein
MREDRCQGIVFDNDSIFVPIGIREIYFQMWITNRVLIESVSQEEGSFSQSPKSQQF